MPATYLDALLALPSLYGAQISPDGAWAAWTWMNAGPTTDVYAAPTDGSAAPIKLTNTPENAQLVDWAPDSRAVLIEQDHEGDERAQIFRVDLDRPGVMQPLTEPSPNYFLRSVQLHPNGRWLIYFANVDFETGQEIEQAWIYRHDLETGERRVLARPQQNGAGGAQLNEQGTHILYFRQDRQPGGYQVWLVDIEGQGDREVLSAGDSAKIFASWLPDGRRVLALAEAGTHRRLGVWDRVTGATRWLIDDRARNLEDAFVPRGSDAPVAVVAEVRNARVHCSLFDLDSGAETPLPNVPGNLTPLRALGAGEWTGEYYRANQPTDIMRFNIADPRPETFTSLTRVWERISIPPEALVPAEDFRWTSIDSLEIQGWLYRAAEPKGTIVHIHGGPTWLAEDRIDPEIQYYVSQGFHVLAPNYRGSTGFGLAFQEAIKQDGWGGREQDDIRTGIAALIAAGIAEAGKVAVTGTSYGGYSSWCAITRCPPELVAAAAPICGMTDLVIDYETTRPDLRPYSAAMLGGRPDQVPERYHQRSPINFVQSIKGRLLIVQGLRDPNVTPENVRAVSQALQQARVEYQTLVFEDEGHGISRPKNQKLLFERLAQFFAEAFANQRSNV
jgi:dipeptidyl aminopeptidase/acylaminoacyl peptidase